MAHKSDRKCDRCGHKEFVHNQGPLRLFRVLVCKGCGKRHVVQNYSKH